MTDTTTRNPSPTQTALKESPNLDVLRAFAVSWVLLSHLAIALGVKTIWGPIEPSLMGSIGVHLFFVHTSCVLMMSLDRQVRQFGWRNLFSIFMIRRTMRVFPLSVVTVAVYAVLGIPGILDFDGFHAATLRPVELLANLALLQNFFDDREIVAPLWSLPYEMQMYLLLPFLYRWMAIRERAFAKTIFVWGCVFITFQTVQPWLNGRNELLSPWHIPDMLKYVPAFLPGIAAYTMFKEKMGTARWQLLVVAIFAVTLVRMLTYDPARLPVICLIIGVMLPLLADVTTPWIKGAAKVVAKYSYGIYLLHFGCYYVAFELCAGFPVAARIAIAGATVALTAFGAYHMIEKPGIDLGTKLVGRMFGERQKV